jgi:selenocysteine lyase/cysteine desulfurase
LEQINPARRAAFLPMYTCEAVIMPFLKKGYEIHFYDQKTDLSNDEQGFLASLKKSKPGIVLLHGYFGFDTLSCLRPYYPDLHKQGIIVIEDISHSLFSDFSKAGADFYVASPRKWFALPDGGVAISPEKQIKMKKLGIHEELVRVNLEGLRMKAEYVESLNGKLKVEYRKLFYSTEEMLNNDCNVYAMSGAAQAILAGMDFITLAAARRGNFKYLLEHLPKGHLLAPVFNDLPDGVVPLYFPVYVNNDRDKLRAFLAEDEIYAPVHWDLPSACAPRLSAATRYIYDHILSIPIDQRYTHKDMARILTRLAGYNG